MKYPDKSGEMILYGKVYNLKQMHWHAPSEHRIDGKQFAAELHLVHIADDGSVSVIAILFDYGRPDPLVAKLEDKVKRHEEAPVTVGPFHPEELRKRTHKYYRYVGSFSTPPCTENVIWSILGKVRSISREQVGNNNRPCQPLNGRHVELYQAEPIA
ncbi:hypothetical protein ACJIZ3_023866 [Penstemon smallii]|uniref:Carbonic anhydrase n=1 Tax=Penstemon smallii TaxID=265156 RepID=A0ABD3TSK9_9LAMI